MTGSERPLTAPIDAPAAERSRRAKAASVVKRELVKIVVRILFLWVMFGLFALNQAVILSHQHIDYTIHGFALINAIVMSKVLLIAEEFNFASRFRDERLIYSILYKAASFAILFMVVHVVEEVIKGLIAGHDLAASVPHPTSLAVVACSAAILFIALTPYFAYREVERVLGENRLREMIFKKRPTPAL